MARKKSRVIEQAGGVRQTNAAEIPTLPLGTPLADILDATGVRGSFELANHLLQRSDNPTIVQQYATFSNADTFTLFAESVIERLADRPELHERARAYVGAEEFRQQFSRDMMTLVGVTLVEDNRIAASRDPAIVAGWEQFGITPREDLHTDEDRAQSHAMLVASLQNSIAELSFAYLEHTIAAITATALQPTPAMPSLAHLVRDEHFKIPASLPAFAVLNAMHDATPRKIWDDFNGQRVPTHTSKTGRKTAYPGEIFISYRGKDEKIEPSSDMLSNLWEQVATLDDVTSDVFIACLAACAGKNEATWISVDGFLDARDLTPIRKADEPQNWRHGHRTEDRLAIEQAFDRLDHIWIEIKNVRVTKKGRPLNLESKAVALIDRLTQPTLNGEKNLRAVRVQLGVWAKAYQEIEVTQVGYLARKVLSYDPYRQRPEKRLGKYLAFHYKFNKLNPQKSSIRRQARDLVDASGITLNPTRPHLARQRLDKTLDCLRQDGVIGQWRYIYDVNQLPARRWLEDWLNGMIEIEAPAFIQERYASLPSSEQHKKREALK